MTVAGNRMAARSRNLARALPSRKGRESQKVQDFRAFSGLILHRPLQVIEFVGITTIAILPEITFNISTGKHLDTQTGAKK